MDAQRPLAVAGHERSAVQAVPRAVAYHRELLYIRGLDRLQAGFVPEVLLPVDVVGFVSGETVKVEYFLAVLGNAGKVGFGNGYGCIIFD